VTVMFCDLVGSTSVSAGLDAEDWRDLVGAHLDAASAAVMEMGGNVAKKLGDGLMALFGYPMAQENDAERAARAALSIQRLLSEINRTNAGAGKAALSARIGIETGTVVVDAAGEVYGDAPNTAAQVSHALAAFLSDIASAAVQSRCRMRITQAAYSPSASATATRGLRRGELGAGDWHPSCLYLRPPIRRPSFSRHGNQS
jgi:class 3 adenylate cyclase